MSKKGFIFYCAMLNCATNVQTEVVNIQDKNQFEMHVVQEQKTSVVKFYSPWCGVCKAIEDDFNSVSKDVRFKDIAFLQVNIEKLSDIAAQYNVRGVPTISYFVDGKHISHDVGVSDTDTFAAGLKERVAEVFHLSQDNGDMPTHSEVQEPATFLSYLSCWFNDTVSYIKNAVSSLFS